MKILVVDDDMNSRELLRCALEESGYSVFLAENGAEAIKVFERERIRFVSTTSSSRSGTRCSKANGKRAEIARSQVLDDATCVVEYGPTSRRDL